MTILIVEDNAILAKNIGRIFAQKGLATRVAGSLREAYRLFRECDVSAICLDLQLPDGHGLSFLDHLVQDGREIPAVVMTGTGTEGDRRRAIGLGVRAFLIKPFALAALESVISNAIDNQAQAEQQLDCGAPGTADQTGESEALIPCPSPVVIST